MMVDGEGEWKIKQNSYGAKVAAFQFVSIIKTRKKSLFFFTRTDYNLGISSDSGKHENCSSCDSPHF